VEMTKDNVNLWNDSDDKREETYRKSGIQFHLCPYCLQRSKVPSSIAILPDQTFTVKHFCGNTYSYKFGSTPHKLEAHET